MWRISAIIIGMVLMISGCGHDDSYHDYPPEAPTGLYSVTGDGEVELYWDDNLESDLETYAVYSSDEEFGAYELEGVTENTYFTINIPNGVTRYLAVAAVDFNGNESDLSYETVWDTPRPDGRDLTVYALFYDSAQTNSDRCGIDFSDYMDYMVQDLENESNDVYIDNFEGVLFLNAFADDTDIALYGYTESITEIDYIDPDLMDWNEEGYIALEEDFQYVIWTWDNHFATVRVQEVYDDSVVLEWAYQTDEGNPELKISGNGTGQKNPANRTLKLRLPKNNKKNQKD